MLRLTSNELNRIEIIRERVKRVREAIDTGTIGASANQAVEDVEYLLDLIRVLSSENS